MNKFVLGMFLLSIVLLNSCLVPKKVVYLEDMNANSTYAVNQKPALRIQKNDRLSIIVSAKNPELAAPFNQVAGSYQVDEKGAVTTASGNEVSTSFVVDQEGNIDFPILGTLKVEDMTLEELKQSLRGKIEGQGFIQQPIVKVELLNLKISVMGAVSKIGVLDVPDAKITLLEAISRSGGITANAAPDKITVIREQNGERKMFVTDIQSKAIFDSPAYYLQQNDIVYVTPKAGELTPRENDSRFFLTTALSLVTVVFTFLNWRK